MDLLLCILQKIRFQYKSLKLPFIKPKGGPLNVSLRRAAPLLTCIGKRHRLRPTGPSHYRIEKAKYFPVQNT